VLWVSLQLAACSLQLGLQTPAWAAGQQPVQETSTTAVPAALVIDDFDKGEVSGAASQRPNAVGGYQGTWSQRPSYTILRKSAAIRRGDRGRSLSIEYSSEGGLCGWYSVLNGIDATPYNCLTFWVRGEQGGEKFDIGLTDERMRELEIDPVYVGAITDVLPGGVTTAWRQVKVPLGRVACDIDVSQLGSLVFWFRHGGQSRVYIEDVALVFDAELARSEQERAPRADRDPKHPCGMWVWKLDPIGNQRQRRQLLDFCERVAVERIYLFLAEMKEAEDPEYARQAGEFLAEASSRGVQVEALTGEPTWAFTSQHEEALEWIGDLLAFNQHRPTEQRFAGVQLDVEPYLTDEWNRDRKSVEEQWVELMRKCRQLIDESGPSFRLGVTVPVFFADEPVEIRRAIVGAADYLALMDYFDTERRILEGFYKHLPVAKEVGTQIVIGVETQDLVQMKQGRPENTFFDDGWKKMERVLARVVEDVGDEAAFLGLAIHHEGSYRYLTPERNVPLKTNRPPVAQLYQLAAVRRDGTPVVVDGDAGEWTAVAPTCRLDTDPYVVYGREQWRGPQDTSMTVRAAWDASMLYLLFDVRDDVVWQEKQRADMWAGDHLEVWLDVDLFGDYTEAVNSQDDIQFGFSPGNFGTIPPEVFVWTPEINPASVSSVQIGARRTAEGYVVEVGIPWRELLRWTVPIEWKEEAEGWGQHPLRVPDRPLRRPVPGWVLGISADLSDTDDVAAPQKCFLSSSVDRAWGDPTTFGALELK